MNDIVLDYKIKFGELPLLMRMTNYDDKIYLELMTKALKRGYPLSRVEIELAFVEQKYDVVEPTENDIKKAILNQKLGED